MIRGQKPTPTSLKLIMGNPGRRPLNDDETKPQGEAVKPAFVKGPAAKLWRKYAPDLIAQGVLTSWDVDMFGAWCVLMSEFQGNPQKFTAAQMSQMRALASSFGLLPAERSRLHTAETEDLPNLAEKYFQSGCLMGNP